MVEIPQKLKCKMKEKNSMFNVFNKVVKKSCCLIVREDDVIKVLDLLDSKRLNVGLNIGKTEACVFDENGGWYIVFNTTKRKRNSIIRELEEVHVVDILVPTKDNFGEVFYQKI
jgi:hypothetical protein